MTFRLTGLLGVLLSAWALTGCTATTADAEEADVGKTVAPLVGTWRWSGSGHHIGDQPLGEDHFVFHADGTYSSFSISGEGERDCYNGLYSWSGLDARGYATIVFKNDRVRSAPNGFVSEVHFESGDTLDFGPAGRYVRAAPLPELRCQSSMGP